MRNNSETFDIYNQAPQRQLRLVVEIGYDIPLYISSHTDIPGLPANAILGTLKKCSSTSQKIIPEQGLAQIGAISFEVVDIAAQLSYVLRDELEQGRGIKGSTVRLYQGFAGLAWEDFRLEQTQIAEESISYTNGIYRVRCRDIQREMRSDIFVLNSTRLSADFSKSDVTLQVYDASSFEPNPHTSAYGDAPNQSVYYLKIKYQDGFEIVRATGKTDSSFTGCTRGLFGTYARDHILPEDSDDESGVEVEEFVYLEGPGPQLAYALLTGAILGTDDALPSNWHLGIDPNYVVLDQFENIGSDWYKPSDHSKGKILRFDGLEETDGKKFIETEINLLLGAFMPVNAAGQLGFRRMAGVLADSGSVATIGPDDVTSLGELKYSLAGVRNVFSVEWSWFEQPGFDGKYLRTNHVLDADSIAVHGEAKQHTLAFRGLHNSRHTYTTIKNTFDALRDRFAGPPLSLRLGLLPSKNDLEVGDIVRVSLPQLRDHSIRGDRPYDFNFASDNEGWIPRDGITTSIVNDGVLAINVVGENPWISRSFSPTFPGADLPYLKLRIRRTSDEPIAAGTGSKLFFKHTGSSSYFSAGADEMLDLIERMNSVKDEWQEFVLDLSQEDDWTGGDIELIRIDIGHDHTADYSYELDYIRLLPALGMDEYSLDRAMEVQRVSINQVTGAVSVDLFGSYQPAGMIADQSESTSAELPDEWYESEGTAMAAAGLSIDASGFLSADGLLTGDTNSRVIYFHAGDLTIPAERTLSVSDNVELRIRGVLQVEGELIGIPGNKSRGFLGSCRGGSGEMSGVSASAPTTSACSGELVVGRNEVMPQLNIENYGGELQGIPDDLRGSGGAEGGKSYHYQPGDWAYDPSGLGGAGGGGGAGIVAIARGIAFGVSGKIDSSGGDGIPGTKLSGSPGNYGGSGGGGAPGGVVLLVDGTDNPMPVLTNSKIIACYGDSPDSPGRAGLGGTCLGTNAVRLLFVPKSRVAYPDHGDPALDPDVKAALDAADTAQASAEAAQADADAALDDLASIAADGILHPTEKLQVIREYSQLIAEQAGIETQANEYGITDEKTDYTAAISALASYLNGLTPTWNDATASTPISRSIWEANWEYVYEQRQALLRKVSERAAEGARLAGLGNNLLPGSLSVFSGYALPPFFGGSRYSLSVATVTSPPNSRCLQVDFTGSTGQGMWLDFRHYEGQRVFEVEEGKTYIISAWSRTKTQTMDVRIELRNADDENSHFGYSPYLSYGYWFSRRSWTVTATGSGFCYLRVAAVNLDAEEYLRFDCLMIEEAIGNQTKPSSYSRPSGGYTDPETGMIFDQRGLPQNIGSVASLPTSSTVLSGSDNGSSAKITISAHTVQYAGFTVSYNSGSITGLNFSTTYYVYVNDADYTGGGVTYYATTEIWQLAAGIGRRAIGTITTPADGGGTTTPPDPFCVDYDTVLSDGRYVRDLQPGDLVECIDMHTGERGEFPLRAMGEGEEECYSLRTPEGAEIWQSKSTPMDLPDGSMVRTSEMLGKPVYVLSNGVTQLSVVSVLQKLSVRRVLKPDLGNRMFFAGRKSDLTIATHNATYKP
ncbi:hypothetical protein [Microbulbifer sp. PAAF003]|uniref:hypothetical protein n=1 Tax=Microbulbifer sp. PAAF003 TaxID=3243375 RepID=UPI00403A02BB